MNNNDIPQGYKDSPLGTIPQEWEVKRLGEVLSPISTFSFSREQMTEQEQELRYIHYGDIHRNIGKDSIDLKTDKLPFVIDGLIPEKKLDKDDFPYLKNGDILLADASEDYDGVGKSWEIINTSNCKIIGGLHTIGLRCKSNDVITGYGRYIFLNEQGVKSLKRVAQGTKVYSISYSHISKLNIILPPPAEQQKIAEVLSLWDEAIERQARMVDLLTTRKRALMQRLLKPKKHWEKVSYATILNEVKRTLKWDDNELYKLISVKRRSGGLFERESLYGRDIKTKNLRPAYEGDFLISKMQIVHGASGLTTHKFHNMKISGSYIALIAENANQLDMRYFNWYSNTPRFYHQTYISSFGVHIEKMTFDLGSFMALGMKLPPLPEQKSIAKKLSTADAEIDLACRRLDLLRTQKKGLMQQLLTGKKRLII